MMNNNSVLCYSILKVRHVDHISKGNEENDKCRLLNYEIPKIHFNGGGTFTAGALVEAKVSVVCVQIVCTFVDRSIANIFAFVFLCHCYWTIVRESWLKAESIAVSWYAWLRTVSRMAWTRCPSHRNWKPITSRSWPSVRTKYSFQAIIMYSTNTVTKHHCFHQISKAFRVEIQWNCTILLVRRAKIIAFCSTVSPNSKVWPERRCIMVNNNHEIIFYSNKFHVCFVSLTTTKFVAPFIDYKLGTSLRIKDRTLCDVLCDKLADTINTTWVSIAFCTFHFHFVHCSQWIYWKNTFSICILCTKTVDAANRAATQTLNAAAPHYPDITHVCAMLATTARVWSTSAIVSVSYMICVCV